MVLGLKQVFCYKSWAFGPACFSRCFEHCLSYQHWIVWYPYTTRYQFSGTLPVVIVYHAHQKEGVCPRMVLVQVQSQKEEIVRHSFVLVRSSTSVSQDLIIHSSLLTVRLSNGDPVLPPVGIQLHLAG